MLVRFVGRDHPRPWNKGLLVGQKKPLQPKHIWSIRVRLEIARMWRDLALFNLAIDSKLRACDLVKLRIARNRCATYSFGWRSLGESENPVKSMGLPLFSLRIRSLKHKAYFGHWLTEFDRARLLTLLVRGG